ncbi:MAG TPA: AmmeMemoRadiSam system protein B [Candidatus Brocadiia bacterium]|nr:AmmeMemoRadiSam system protein B [Candidatus Brocadiia bacterium]
MIPEKPRLRALEVIPCEMEGEQVIVLRDPTNMAPGQAVLHSAMLHILILMNGENTVRDMQVALTRQFGELVPSDKLAEMIGQLDEALFLESERFDEYVANLKKLYRESPSREAAHAGTGYPEEEAELREFLDSLFTENGGPGLPESRGTGRPLRGFIAPHIDLGRGGLCYARTYRRVMEAAPAETYVILGTSHSGSAPVSLTAKDFETPIGKVRADAGRVEALARGMEDAYFEDELAHLNEHTIEFQALMLQHALGGRADFSIVPVLCSRLTDAETNPAGERGGEIRREIRNLCDTLASWAGEGPEKVCIIASADLSHVGARFGQQIPISPLLLKQVENADRTLLGFAGKGDPDGFLEHARQECEDLNVCGIPPIYVLLNALRGREAELVSYQQSVEEEMGSMVTFAGMAFHA